MGDLIKINNNNNTAVSICQYIFLTNIYIYQDNLQLGKVKERKTVSYPSFIANSDCCISSTCVAYMNRYTLWPSLCHLYIYAIFIFLLLCIIAPGKILLCTIWCNKNLPTKDCCCNTQNLLQQSLPSWTFSDKSVVPHSNYYNVYHTPTWAKMASFPTPYNLFCTLVLQKSLHSLCISVFKKQKMM